MDPPVAELVQEPVHQPVQEPAQAPPPVAEPALAPEFAIESESDDDASLDTTDTDEDEEVQVVPPPTLRINVRSNRVGTGDVTAAPASPAALAAMQAEWQAVVTAARKGDWGTPLVVPVTPMPHSAHCALIIEAVRQGKDTVLTALLASSRTCIEMSDYFATIFPDFGARRDALLPPAVFHASHGHAPDEPLFGWRRPRGDTVPAREVSMLELMYFMLAREIDVQGEGVVSLTMAHLPPGVPVGAIAAFVQGTSPAGLLGRVRAFLSAHVNWEHGAIQERLPTLMLATSLWNDGASKGAMLSLLCAKFLPYIDPVFGRNTSATAVAAMWALKRTKALRACLPALRSDRFGMIELLTTPPLERVTDPLAFLTFLEAEGAFTGLGEWAAICSPHHNGELREMLRRTTRDDAQLLAPFWQRSGLLTADTLDALMDLDLIRRGLEIDLGEVDKLFVCLRVLAAPDVVARLFKDVLQMRHARADVVLLLQRFLARVRGVWQTPGLLRTCLLRAMTNVVVPVTRIGDIVDLLRAHANFGSLTLVEREELTVLAKTVQRRDARRSWWTHLQDVLEAGVGMKRRRPF
jgi:hypothetical protein